MTTARGEEASDAALREEKTETRRGERRQRDVVKYLNRRVGTRGGERARGGRMMRAVEWQGGGFDRVPRHVRVERASAAADRASRLGHRRSPPARWLSCRRVDATPTRAELERAKAQEDIVRTSHAVADGFLRTLGVVSMHPRETQTLPGGPRARRPRPRVVPSPPEPRRGETNKRAARSLDGIRDFPQSQRCAASIEIC